MDDTGGVHSESGQTNMDDVTGGTSSLQEDTAAACGETPAQHAHSGELKPAPETPEIPTKPLITEAQINADLSPPSTEQDVMVSPSAEIPVENQLDTSEPAEKNAQNPEPSTQDNCSEHSTEVNTPETLENPLTATEPPAELVLSVHEAPEPSEDLATLEEANPTEKVTELDTSKLPLISSLSPPSNSHTLLNSEVSTSSPGASPPVSMETTSDFPMDAQSAPSPDNELKTPLEISDSAMTLPVTLPPSLTPVTTESVMTLPVNLPPCLTPVSTYPVTLPTDLNPPALDSAMTLPPNLIPMTSNTGMTLPVTLSPNPTALSTGTTVPEFSSSTTLTSDSVMTLPVTMPSIVTSMAPDLLTLPQTSGLIPVPQHSVTTQASPATAVVTTTQNGLVPGSQSFAGAINLTISNGSINLKPQSQSVTQGIMLEAPKAPTGAPVIRGTSTSLPYLTQPPVVSGNLNVKLTGPTMNIRMPGNRNMLAARPTMLAARPTMLAARPTMLAARPTMLAARPTMLAIQTPGQLHGGTTLQPVTHLQAVLPRPGATQPLLSQPRLLTGHLPFTVPVVVSSSSLVSSPVITPGVQSILLPSSSLASTNPVRLPNSITNNPSLTNSQVDTKMERKTPDLTDNSVSIEEKINGEKKVMKRKRSADGETGDSGVASKMKTEPGEKKDDFDPTSGMEWKDGMWSLPGSDLKFCLNEFGVMELVTEDEVKDEEKMETTSSSHSQPESTRSTSTPATSNTGSTSSEMKASSDDILCCARCSTYGMQAEFYTDIYCSKSCHDANMQQMMQNKGKVEKTSSGRKKKRRLEGDGERRVEEEEEAHLLTSTIHSSSGKRSKSFSWAAYLEQEKARPAPSRLFKNPFPSGKNGFKVGSKLEGIDPDHPAYYCVLSVAEVRGYRLRLHFDGYNECYDFWTNADSPFIFPVGWTERNGKKLQPPKGYTADTFNWTQYLRTSKYQPAPKHLFCNTQATTVTPHNFRVGAKLEAVDKKNTALTCVASISDVLGERILVHFDGWEDSYDYWGSPSSPYIHPVGWCQQTGNALSPPNDWPDIAGFTWEEYLTTTKSQAIPARAFKTRPPNQFSVGMKVEVVDRRNPVLVRVASLVAVEAHQVKVHFDGWLEVYDYWLDDDSTDIHPPGWCTKTGHPLTPPITAADMTSSPNQGGCPTPGCNGVGHIKGPKYTGHHSAFGCPYSNLNMNKETVLPDRFATISRQESTDTPLSITIPRSSFKDSSLSPESRKCPTMGCDGQGHVTGKYPAHHKLSGCPLATDRTVTSSSNSPHVLIDDETGKPLVGPGSGRGRKKNKIRQLILQQKEMMKSRGCEGGVLSLASPSSDSTMLLQGIHQSVFMTSMTPVTPGHRTDLSLCWEQHSKLLPGVSQYQMEDVAKWDVTMVADFIATLPGCQNLVEIFLEQQIDGEAFLLLTQTDIVNILKIKLGPALKIYNSILMVKSNSEPLDT